MKILLTTNEVLSDADVTCKKASCVVDICKHTSVEHLIINNYISNGYVTGYHVVLELLSAKQCPLTVEILDNDNLASIADVLLKNGYTSTIDGRKYRKIIN